MILSQIQFSMFLLDSVTRNQVDFSESYRSILIEIATIYFRNFIDG